MIKPYVVKSSEPILDSCLSHLISRTAPDYIVEIGAFDGSALREFGKISPYSKRVGFEANPTNFFNLCLGKDVQYMAVSNVTGTIKFYEQLPDQNVRSSSPGRMLKKIGSIFKYAGAKNFIEYTVPCTTLDDFFKTEIESGKTFVLIIDAEGTTKEILEGGRNFLKNVTCIKIEVEKEEIFENQSLEHSCFNLLRNMILIGEQIVAGKEKLKQTNYYFISDIKYSSAFSGY
jgi:FkbM family methyltransferase